MSTDELKVEGLRCEFGPVVAVARADLQVGAGETVCIVGPSGAGKTTLLRSIVGQVPAKQGRITFGHRDITRLAPAARVGLGMALCPEQRRLFQGMSVGDNIRVGAFRQGRKVAAKRLEEMLAIFPSLAPRVQQDVATLSGGEQQMVALARALASRPKLLLLDEPTLGLAPIVVKGLFAQLAGVRREGTAILLVEQNARAAIRAADRYCILVDGSIRDTGDARAIDSGDMSLDMYFRRPEPKQDGQARVQFIQ